MSIKWIFTVMVILVGCRPAPQNDLQLSATPDTEATFVAIGAAEEDMQLLGCACQQQSPGKFKLYSYYVRDQDGFKVALAAAVMPLAACIEARRSRTEVCRDEELQG